MNQRPSALEALAADPRRAGLLLDFDGVLAPIVQDPTTSALPESVAESLDRLQGALGLVAVISGRPVNFLADRIHISGISLLGSYGIEQVKDDSHWVDPEAQPWLAAIEEARLALDDLLNGDPGIYIEEKSVSVAVHWRRAPDHHLAAERVRNLTASVAHDTGLRLEPGKLVIELRPPIDADKGSAVSSLLEASMLGAVAYAGDDLGDVPALRKVREAGGYALVVNHGSETDPLLLQLADQTFAGTEGFASWLDELAEVTNA